MGSRKGRKILLTDKNNNTMKAIDIVNYIIDNDLTKEELSEVGLKLLEYIPAEKLLAEIDNRL